MKTKLKVLSVTDVIDTNFDPPMRYTVHLQCVQTGAKIAMHGLTDSQVLPFAALTDDGRLKRDWSNRLYPSDTAFFVEAEKQSNSDKAADSSVAQAPTPGAPADNAPASGSPW